MENKIVIIICVCIAFSFLGCKSTFYKTSKNISGVYKNENFAEYDLLYNHPIRIKVKNDGIIDDYNKQKDTITFVQYSNRHDGDIGTLIVLNKKLIFPFKDTNQYGEMDRDIFPTEFLDAVVQWDTTYINALPEEHSFHKGIIFIARVIDRKIAVLQPRSYEIKK